MTADAVMEEAQRFQSVLREIERLPKAERHVLLLSALEELDTAEIAAVLGRSESAVRALLSRARARLRDRISCHAALDRAACAPFREERRMKTANATNLDRKSGERLEGEEESR
jgi:DNA-binding CsgD family transcriptional regulator